MFQEILTQIEPALVSLAVAFILALITVLGKVLLKVQTLIIAKIGKENFESAKSMAFGLWLLLEKNYPQLSGEAKRLEMGNRLLAQFPSLTQDQLDAINKEVNNMLTRQTKVVIPCEITPTPGEEAEFTVESSVTLEG